ncbi:glycosyltransferase family 2 protein [Desulfoferrobacter suflitae]|uniref:glycosyltransferase family 2 protein n=1 Tax=Desulfoferrobacter suflitae TaxID=2865782 RepID=UPI0021641917|nr:glycosyltransferase family 2 protein [Desulfoferrobacter suflitae]MCK8603847.1 glycosyltransferase family 2 protein [Desulfoferrobacter suflitae]
MDNSGVVLSVVIPIKDEAENIELLAEQLNAALGSELWSWECIWVDDGSCDESLAILERLVGRDSRHRYLSFAANAGQSAAFWAGFKAAKGAFIATIDGDGQNDPADIPGLMAKIQGGSMDMINGYRARRKDTFIRKVASRIANAFRNFVTGNTVSDVGCSTRVFKRQCIESLPKFKGMHRFLPTLVAMQGFTLAEVAVNHRPRQRGKTKYSINNRLWVGLMDTFGVLWLQKRSFTYRVRKHS